MFGIGFSEMVLIGIVALLVLGPERLPRVARTAGLFVRRARMQWNTLTADLVREAELPEAQDAWAASQAALARARAAVSEFADDARADVASVAMPARTSADDE